MAELSQSGWLVTCEAPERLPNTQSPQVGGGATCQVALHHRRPHKLSNSACAAVLTEVPPTHALLAASNPKAARLRHCKRAAPPSPPPRSRAFTSAPTHGSTAVLAESPWSVAAVALGANWATCDGARAV